MKLPRMLLAAVVFLTAAGFPTFAGSHQQQSDQDAGEQASHQQARPQHAGPQNGQQVAPPDSSTQDSSASSDQALPPETPDQSGQRAPIPQGTRLLIGLQDALSTKEDKAGKRFIATTLEPVTTAEGIVIPAGLQIRGHIDRVQSAGKAGRARMWLTFDDIGTPRGWRPLVAQLIDAPGVHSVHVVYDHEGEIQAASTKRDQAMQAAAAAAMVSAATGVAAGKEKEAAMRAAIAAATAYMIASGLGQEITLEKGMKLELVLVHPLHLGRT